MTANNSETHFGLPGHAFGAYITASSLWLAAMTLSGFVGSWLLVERVGASPEQTGLASSISRVVPLALLLVGGVLIDRSNNRSYLIVMHVLITLPALILTALVAADRLSYPAVVAFMVGMSAVQALSDPARQAVLSRVAPTDIQRSVTLVALASSVVSFLAISLGGSMDRLGDVQVLLLMAGLFALSLWPILRLPSLPRLQNATSSRQSNRLKDNDGPDLFAWRDLVRGTTAVWQHSVLRSVIACNFASSLFNAGAYTVAIPFIARDIYAGDSQTFAWALGAVTVGAGLSSLLLLLVMPFTRPGRVFLAFQLTRAAILIGLWANFGQWTFYGLMGLWGVNMGVTSTLARSIVQAQAPEAQRGKIFSLMLLSFMLASAIGAPVLGIIVGAADPLTALLPGVAVSILIFLSGRFSDLWQHQADLPIRPADAQASGRNE